MFPEKGSLICPSDKSMIFFYEKATDKNELVARPAREQPKLNHRYIIPTTADSSVVVVVRRRKEELSRRS